GIRDKLVTGVQTCALPIWEEVARSVGVADRVRWAGYRRDVDAILPGCDVFVLPSLEDAFPTVLLEAMASGLPAVASNVGGIPERSEEGRVGDGGARRGRME